MWLPSITRSNVSVAISLFLIASSARFTESFLRREEGAIKNRENSGNPRIGSGGRGLEMLHLSLHHRNTLIHVWRILKSFSMMFILFWMEMVESAGC